jgi:hypothetical protein
MRKRRLSPPLVLSLYYEKEAAFAASGVISLFLFYQVELFHYANSFRPVSAWHILG